MLQETFTLEQLISCCYILEGINEHEFLQHLAKFPSNSSKNLFTLYFASRSPDHQTQLVREILAHQRHISFADFSLTVSNHEEKDESKDPLSDPHTNLQKEKPSKECTIKEQAAALVSLSSLFQQFVRRCCCEENLAFLVDIYNYERLWNICFADRRFSVLKCQIGPNSSIPLRTGTSHRAAPTLSSLQPSNSTATFRFGSFDLKGSFDASSIVDTSASRDISDLKDASTFRADSLVGKWELEYARKTGEADAAEASTEPVEVNETHSANNPIPTTMRTILNERWNALVQKYLLENAHHQINLPADVFNRIINEHRDPDVLYHAPLVLLGAKDLAVQLLRDNVYQPFLRQFGQEKSQIPDSSECSRRSSTTCGARELSSSGRTSISSVFLRPFLRYSKILGDSPVGLKRTSAYIGLREKCPERWLSRTMTDLRGPTQFVSSVSRSTTDSEGLCNARKSKRSLGWFRLKEIIKR